MSFSELLKHFSDPLKQMLHLILDCMCVAHFSRMLQWATDGNENGRKCVAEFWCVLKPNFLSQCNQVNSWIQFNFCEKKSNEKPEEVRTPSETTSQTGKMCNPWIRKPALTKTKCSSEWSEWTFVQRMVLEESDAGDSLQWQITGGDSLWLWLKRQRQNGCSSHTLAIFPRNWQMSHWELGQKHSLPTQIIKLSVMTLRRCCDVEEGQPAGEPEDDHGEHAPWETRWK